MGRFDSLRELGSAWVDKQKRRLQGKPQTLVDSGGSGIGNYQFNEQAHSRDALKEIKEMREDGGVIATLVHAKALMTFGGGFELESEVDGVEEWINTELPNLETKLLELGEDALWYPYAAGETVETRGNDFSHIAGIEPWTLQPQTDETGSIQYWEQQIGRMDSKRFDTDEIGAIVLNKSCARDTTGISDVLRAKEEIEHYMDIERMVQKSAEVAAVPHNHWKVGRENGAPLDDNDLRRVRTLVERLEGDTQIITGPDVNHERISADDYDFETLIAHKLRQVAIALGVPLEMVASGDHGLGAGSESEIRMRVFEKDARANQRSFANQFENEFLIPIVNEYSPYNVDNTELNLNFTDPIERDDRKERIDAVGEDMTIDERRQLYDLEPIGGDIGDSYDTARGETTEDEGMGGDTGGFFAADGSDTDFRNLKDIEDIDTVPPESVQNDAQMALDWREETGNPNDCGTQVGWERANQIVNGESLSEDTINRMVSFFSRHEKGGDDQPKEDCSRMMWKAWGGDDGKEWAESKQEEFEQAREAQEGDTGFSHDLSEYPEWERCMLEAWESNILEGATDRQLLQNSSSTPEFVFDRIRDAIDSGTLFSEIDAISSSQRMEFRELLKDSLTDDGWSINELRDEIMNFTDVSKDRAENIARSETSEILNTSRSMAYEEQGFEDSKFYWSGQTQEQSDRTTDACDWLIKQTNPFHNGDPVSKERLQEMIQEAWKHDDDMTQNLAREWTVHPQERKTFVRVPGT